MAKHKYFKSSDSDLDPSKGICYGLALSHIQSVLTGNQKEFAEALQLLSRSAEAGWLYRGTVYRSLVEPIKLAFKDYEACKSSNPVPEGKSLFFDLFAKDCPESFKYMQIPARLNSLLIYQAPEVTFLKGLGKVEQCVEFSRFVSPWVFNGMSDDEAPLQATKLWVTSATPKGLEGMLGSLPAGAYLFDLYDHALSADVADEHITIFDQNANLYFLQAEKSEPQSLKMLAKILHYHFSGSVEETDSSKSVPFGIQRIDKRSSNAEEQNQMLKDILDRHQCHFTYSMLGHKQRKALQSAIRADSLESVQAFLPESRLAQEYDKGESLLMLALSNGAGVDVVKALVDAGATQDTKQWEMFFLQKAETKPDGRRQLVG